jgi:hypothetical protein
MMKISKLAMFWAIVLAGAAAAPTASALDNSGNTRYTIKDVMITAYKDKLASKIVKGEATPEEKQRLLVLYEALAKTVPPRGDTKSWQKKTGDLVKAAEAALEGQSDAPILLKKTMECGACHVKHK